MNFQVGDRVKVIKNPSFNNSIKGWVGTVIPIPSGGSSYKYYKDTNTIVVRWDKEYKSSRDFFFSEDRDKDCLEILHIKELI